MKIPSWFVPDMEGLKQLYSKVSKGRLVAELVQNSLDEPITYCEVWLEDTRAFGRPVTRLVVKDDSPNGFADLSCSYRLFAVTQKRLDPTKRGRFTIGEKIVLSQAIQATITSTTGTVEFAPDGRHHRRARTEKGTVVTVNFPRWSKKQTDDALHFLGLIAAPDSCRFGVNGKLVQAQPAIATRECVLPVEIMSAVGQAVRMGRSARKTSIMVRPKVDTSAWLLEMGIPVCEIEGPYDVDIAQKVPLSIDRSSVTPAYLRDVLAEVVLALKGTELLENLDPKVIATALSSSRLSPSEAAAVVRQKHGKNVVIQSPNSDATQEAARDGATILPSSMYGAEVNDHLRAGGIQTTKEAYGRRDDGSVQFKPMDISARPALLNFVDYVKFLAENLYDVSRDKFTVEIGRLESRVPAKNFGGHHVAFDPRKIGGGHKPVSRLSSLIIHELAHCRGDGHDGVYDREFERAVDRLLGLALAHPERFAKFEGGLGCGGKEDADTSMKS